MKGATEVHARVLLLAVVTGGDLARKNTPKEGWRERAAARERSHIGYHTAFILFSPRGIVPLSRVIGASLVTTA